MKTLSNSENKICPNFSIKDKQEKGFLYQEMFEVMIENASVSMYVIEDNKFSYVNAQLCHLAGYSQEELVNGTIALNDLFHPDDLSIVQESMRKKIEDQEISSRYRVRLYRKNKELIHVEIHSTKAIKMGKPFLFGTLIDVTKEVMATLRLKENEEKFKSLFYNNPDAIFKIDLQGHFIDANPGCEKLTGYSADELLGMSFAPLIAAEDLEASFVYFKEAAHGIANSHDLRLIRKDGASRNIEITKFPLKSAGETVAVYGSAKDITEKVEHQKMMEELVFYDPLTKLPNRKLFEDRLGQVFKLADSNENSAAVLFLDLDRFKFINDSLGHHSGDEFLKIVAQRLLANVGNLDTVGRFAGDEFAILLPNSKQQDAIALAKQLNKVLSEPFEIMGHSLSVSASIGIAFNTGTDETIDSLIKKADTAMYYTKKYGKNNYTVYSQELDQKTAYKLILERDLKSAIHNEELILHYQPIVDLKNGELRAMEALIRWSHPELGLVPPDSFIPISEESGQIVAIGKWALQTACIQNKTWQDLSYPPFKVCVNISTIQLQHPNFVQTVKDVLEETGLEGKWLELEVTESILLENTKTLKESLRKLKELGISMSIDDFGTGYTSLSYLQQFSFDRVKIDRSFIEDIPKDRNGKAITSTIISLAHKLNMSVIAEGIEDEIQLNFLKEENCDGGQGYYFSRPLSAESHKLSLLPKKY